MRFLVISFFIFSYIFADTNETNSTFELNKAESLFELGKSYESKRKDKKAKAYYGQSLKIFKDLNISNEIVADETIHLTSTLYNLKKSKLALKILDNFIEKHKDSKSIKIKKLVLRAYLQKIIFYKAQKNYKLAYKEAKKYEKYFNPKNIDKSYYLAYKELEARLLYYLDRYDEYEKSIKELSRLGYDRVYVDLYTIELNLILDKNIDRFLQDKNINKAYETPIYTALKNIYYIKRGSGKLESITDYKILKYFDFSKIENWARTIKDKILNYINNLKQKANNNE